ncbi:MAG: hypothetical protein ACXVFV_08045 [Mycobacteriales bacterium]
MPAARSAALAQLAVGGLLLRLPSPALRVLEHPDGPGPRAVVRVLGARHLVQGAVLLRHHRRADLLRGTAVDLLHGASCLAYARCAPAGRRAGLRAGGLAAALAVLQLAATLPRRTPDPGPPQEPLPVLGEDEIVVLRGGPMDGASVLVPAHSAVYDVVDADRGPQRYQATTDVTSVGWRVFALPHDGPPA